MKFTQDWFSQNIPNFRQIAATTSIQRILEIGSFEGLSTCWMLQNMLPEDGSITCVDTFGGGIEHQHLDMSHTKDLFLENTAEACGREQSVVLHEKQSIEALLDLYSDHETFDFIYVDGSHESINVLEDSVLAWRMLRKGGVMLWDDYRGGAGVSVAVDAFLRVYGPCLEMVLENYQIAVRKTV